MTAVPSTHVFSAGEVVTDTTMNNSVSAPLNFLLARPICQARQTVAQSVANNTSTAITMDSEDVDSSGMHSTSSNTSRLTAVYPGWYQVSSGVSAAANATGFRMTTFKVNGTFVAGSASNATAVGAGASHRQPGRTMLVFLNVGDFVEAFYLQTSSGALNTSVADANTEQSTITAVWTSN